MISQNSDSKDLLSSSELVKSSFFDDIKDLKVGIPQPLDQTLWLHPQDPLLLEPPDTFQPLNQPHLVNQVLIEGPLLSRSKKTNTMKKRYYALTVDRLICYKNQKKEKERRVMLIQGIKLEVFDQACEDEEEKSDKKPDLSSKDANSNLERQCFFLSKNKKYDILFAQTKEEYVAWLDLFKRLCILTYFGKYYNNLKVIGKGTFAKVILSKRNIDNKDFAIKTFDKKSIMSSKSANRTRVGLINEISIMRNLNHPSVIKLYEVYEGEYHVYLVLELLKGGELFDRIIKKGHYSEKDAAILISKLLWALEYIHERGIMHRDIKPENLILKDENEYDIKLADFGLAEKVDKKELLFKRCGTPGYVAPEVLEDKKYDTKVDVYSAGVILYIL